MPVKVKNNTSKVFRGIKQNAEKFIYGVGSIGATLSMNYAPLEYGDLRASQTFETGSNSAGPWARVSFGQGVEGDYAAILENWEGWNPRPPEMKAGPAWNPEARPHYLKLGFEGSEARVQIEQLKKVFKI